MLWNVQYDVHGLKEMNICVGCDAVKYFRSPDVMVNDLQFP